MPLPSLQFWKNCHKKEVTKMKHFVFKTLKLLISLFQFWKILPSWSSQLCHCVDIAASIVATVATLSIVQINQVIKGSTTKAVTHIRTGFSSDYKRRFPDSYFASLIHGWLCKISTPFAKNIQIIVTLLINLENW